MNLSKTGLITLRLTETVEVQAPALQPPELHQATEWRLALPFPHRQSGHTGKTESPYGNDTVLHT